MEDENKTHFTEKKVDDAWKKSIDKEKEHASEADSGSPGPPPFVQFLTSLGMQTLMHLGLLEHPVTKKKEKNLEAARETIDLLLLIRDKTKGNLTPEENALLTNLLADLQLQYVDETR